MAIFNSYVRLTEGNGIRMVIDLMGWWWWWGGGGWGGWGGEAWWRAFQRSCARSPSKVDLSYSRSSGPGGQNVNKADRWREWEVAYSANTTITRKMSSFGIHFGFGCQRKPLHLALVLPLIQVETKVQASQRLNNFCHASLFEEICWARMLLHIQIYPNGMLCMVRLQ